MRRRRQPQDDLHNKERWLISYADFITLLFAFFVVMYSVSSVNEGKYKVLSETFTGVFNAPQRSFQPIEIGDQPPRPEVQPSEAVIPPAVTEAPRNSEQDTQARTEALRTMADQLAMEFDELIDRGVVTLETNDRWLSLNLPDSLLFGSGDAEPHYDAFDVMDKVARVLRNRDNAVKVEGFTDNQPIRTPRFPSNWELSAARAAAVVRMLSMEGIEPERLAAIGYGEYQPLARNDTEEGRRRNRRVVLLISRDASIRGVMRQGI
ncbi:MULTISPECIES: flagellar motor protein MotD [Marinobacter]|uniref:Flagellar motor protein MotD n=1 Tax=Marinobacter xiaoshiensis TaxID=3073652 RepID=A0ABU2HEY0_9GAMM|nr:MULTISPECIES: flagellar motor protein MotD [unclassified Marinobacter]MBK1872082.1 flagellar motor protein MotD [Marinobacter sp. 1-3A]MBK1885540.1 flagellar motor protein MotD [Marinobacter sp. DY40_1A1]MDS1309584.1 flagellar motor protein MotD [Marinobacter sp. F60267]